MIGIKRSPLLLSVLLTFFLSIQSVQAEDGEADPRLQEMQELFGDGLQEEDLYRAERLLVTATGSQVPVRLAPSVASVITAEDIERIGASTLDEVLEVVPGLHVTPSSRWFTPIWSIRGIHTSINPHVLLLINGVPMTSSYTGTRALSYRMPVAMISRVEVVRGPGSALHGADAYAGVVNVITKDNHDIDGSRAGIRYGSFDTHDMWLQYGANLGADLWFGLQNRKTEGDKGRIVSKDFLHANGAAQLSNAPGYIDTSYELLDANLGFRKNGFEFHLYGSLQEDSGGPGAAQTLVYANDIDYKILLTDLTYSTDSLLPGWHLSSRLHYLYLFRDTHVEFFPEEYLNMIGEPISTGKDGGFDLSAETQLLQIHNLRLGAGIKFYEFEPEQYKNFGPAAAADPFGELVEVTDQDHIYISDANRTIWYGLIQDEWGLARDWTLTAGVRYDRYSDFGSTTNPRAALVWEARYDLTCKLLYGQAFRAPSFAELYIKNNVSAIGSDDLDPEEIETLELVFDYQPFRQLHTLFNFYIYEAENLIEYTGYTAGIAAAVAENSGEQVGYGIEIEMSWSISNHFLLRSNLAYQHSENKKTDSDVPDAPQLQLYFNPHYRFAETWSLDGQYFWISERSREEADFRNQIDDYHIVNLTLRKKEIAGHWDLALSVRNLFDEDAREPSPYDQGAPEGAYMVDDYPMEGRAVWAEISCHF